MLMQRPDQAVLQRGSLLSSQLFQLVCYALFGVGLPLAVWLSARTSFDFPYVRTTVAAVVIAGLTTWYMLANLRVYARARRLSYVLPVNFLTFGGVSAVLFLLRLPYSISLLLACAVCTAATSYLLTALTRVGTKPQYIVPGGRIDELERQNRHILATSPEMIERKIAERSLDGSLVADLHYDHEPVWERLFAQASLAGIPVYHFRQITEMETGQVRIDHLSENVLGSLIPNLPYMAVKRGIDLLGVVVLAPLLLVVMLGIALVIRLDSKGPILFFQERMGFRGEVFRMVKFRTMRERSVADDELAQRKDSMTKDDDDRITRVGRFLRKARLDELPQAWNILRGDMSWIGPRPEAINLSEWYENEIPFYSYRHIVRPGITGWAQVNQGHVTDLNSVSAKLRFDFYYVKNISHWLDLLIALKTVRVILGGLGAR